MQLICQTQALVEAVSNVQRAVSGKTTIPALEGILFQTSGDKVSLTGYDLELGISTNIQAQVQREGRIVLPAKMLGDALYFKAYAKLSDGSYVYTDIAGYHAVLYANTILNSSAASAQAKSLVVAMLNYGAAAQVSFEYKTDSLMNANLTSAQKALVSAYSESMIAAVPSVSTTKAGSFVNNGGYSDLHPTVSFEGAFSINYYFTPKYTPDNSTITFYYWNLNDFNANNVLAPYNSSGSVKMTLCRVQYSMILCFNGSMGNAPCNHFIVPYFTTKRRFPQPPVGDIQACRCLVKSARIAFRTAMTITPTSAKMASHMLAMPNAPRIRQSTLTPMANQMFS